MRKTVRESEDVLRLKKMLRDKHLHTVCESAGCPNFSQCFQKPTATFLILGDVCTRGCLYCGVAKGNPKLLDADEPARVAEAALELKIKHVVVTSVTRDDLPDGGASQFARTVEEVHRLLPQSTVEVLVPDFKGSKQSLKTVIESGINILNHNVETVPRLYPKIRPEADFNCSINLLKYAKILNPDMITKSGLMVGLSETEAEVESVFQALANVNCDALTIGQYLQPNRKRLPVQSYILPEMFENYEKNAKSFGIPWVQSGPFVRSSFNAEELMEACQKVEIESI